MKEEWKDIKGYEGIYQISNLGNVKCISNDRRLSIMRNLLCGKYGKDAHRHREIFQYDLDGNFLRQWDCMSDVKRELGLDVGHLCHVAKNDGFAGVFLWSYSLKEMPKYKTVHSVILQFDQEGNFIKEYSCVTDAAKALNSSTGRICSCLKGRTKTCRGYIFKYKD